MTLNLATILREGALRHPDRTAIVLGSRKSSYGSVDSAARRLAGALAASGVRRGDTVALMLPNVPEFPIAYFAAHYTGAIVVPLNVLLTADEVEYTLRDSRAVALVAWEGFVEAAVAGFARIDTCRLLIVARSEKSMTPLPEPALDLQRLVADASPVAETAPTNPEDTAVILYTSGTTGRPKGAELTHFNLFYNAEYCRTTLLPLPSDEAVALAALPLFHSFGQTVVQNRFLMSGGTVVLLPRFEPLAVLRAIAEHRVSFFAGVPTMYVALLGVQTSEELDLASLKICVLIFPRFRGHPNWRENAHGVIHGQTKEAA
jgi:long-chain acyl-CoA synthetase